MPTPAVPTSLQATNPNSNGELDLQWAGSYADRDLVFVYNAADDSLLGILKADLNIGTICNLLNDVLYTIYLKATEDNVNFSAASNSDTGTPTGAAIDSETTVGVSRTNSGVV